MWIRKGSEENRCACIYTCAHTYMCVHTCWGGLTHPGGQDLERRVGKSSGADGAMREARILWSPLGRGVPSEGGPWQGRVGLASSRRSFRASAVCWGPSPATPSFPESGCAGHCAYLFSQVIGVLTPRRGSMAVCVLSEGGPGHPGPPPPGRRR